MGERIDIASASKAASPSEGLVVAGRYELEALIGEGGMARVWRGRDLTLERQVAVKFLFLREDRDRRTMLDRFLREARIAAAVRHPNVVDLLDFGTTEEGRPFMVMELLAGESLEQRLSRAPTLTLEELIRLAAGVLDGLAAVHKAGIVHRDLKPDNVFLLDDDGEVRPKLLDFGVSRETDATSGRRSALTTNDGYLVGTPEYMSPEQARGLKDVDWRTDIYSAGVVLYEAMTGHLPYNADAVGDLIIDIVGGGAPAVMALRPEIGERLSAVVAKAMSVKREDRYQSARDMRDALLSAAEESLGIGVRASLPLVIPARRASVREAPASDRPAASEVSTLDGLEMPWGASAVPLLAAERAPEEKKSWSVETELPEAKTRPWLVLGAVLAIPLAGLATWLALRAPGEPHASTPPVDAPAARAAEGVTVSPEPASAEPIAEATPAERSAGEPGGGEPGGGEPRAAEPGAAEPSAGEPAEAAPSPEAPALVSVTLDDLPPRARVRVDDAWVEPEGGVITLPRDGASHSLYVLAPGRRVWRGAHEASADGRYRVRLRPQGGGREGGGESGGVFRDLDY